MTEPRDATDPGARVVIVGASAAGSGVALNLRRMGYEGAITLIGEEAELPYDRPPLSKGVLLGTAGLDSLGLASHEELSTAQVELRLGVRAVALDTTAKEVRLETGESVGYDTLVIATGATPRRIPSLAGSANVHVLRTIADAEAFERSLVPGTRLAIVGSGLIGLEVASTATKRGVQVSVIEPADLPMRERLTPDVARWLLDQHVAHGVRFHLGTQVEGVVSDGDRVTALCLADGTELEVDVVLMSVGAAPNVAWLESSGIELDNGVVTDHRQRAADDVYAVGDVARFVHTSLDRVMRMETRSNAIEGAVHLARTIAGEEAPYAPVPFFWTDQYDFKIQSFGMVDPTADLVFEDGSLEGSKWVLAAYDDGELRGVIARGHGPVLARLRRQLAQNYQRNAERVLD
ncbi:NAD(P)/FAD-dependent oxidoreductase [Microbacterium thalassium]|uniref:NADPH-dependent 2,4-dienoyl-CoA reductase/sulfur reductase-like enzyme n=1 Tax=Microbacterium thalassium TaxID=362649 RepID=A0A7X0FN06_9MICO|nr:FAD-dependent oxidoreductase [Microbacterium thalassium]MBB6390508.1 NADPH-dependent 2,4-dienoyl-CoA reductase/sulfur reductase-like enzyme [Microbacterium thalassium]GLK25619.1 pyridine nucleotide-disulfide oxidoreductase [Microbacterium thalassium]